jgi:hypothetical protein
MAIVSAFYQILYVYVPFFCSDYYFCCQFLHFLSVWYIYLTLTYNLVTKSSIQSIKQTKTNKPKTTQTYYEKRVKETNERTNKKKLKHEMIFTTNTSSFIIVSDYHDTIIIRI